MRRWSVLPSILRILGRLNPHYDLEQRRRSWRETSTPWINVVQPGRMQRATGMARGERGVLVLRLDTADMDAMIAGSGLTGRTPPWLNYRDFTALLSRSDDLPLGTAQRWAAQIMRADPHQDVSLFFLRPPDDRGRSFSRFITIRDGRRARVMPLRRSEFVASR